MKTAAWLLVVLVLLFIVWASEADDEVWWGPYPAVYGKNYDADTITVMINHYPKSWRWERIRLDGIDAPEIRGKCEKEKRLAIQARDYVRALLEANKPVLVKVSNTETFGRRVGRVYIGERRLADMLVESELAKPAEHQLDWCGLAS